MLNIRGEESEVAFDGLEWEALRVGQYPAVGALEPFGAVALDAIRYLREADDGAGFKGVRRIGNAVAALDVFQFLGGEVRPALAGVDENGAAQLGCPYPVCNAFVAVDNEPCPRQPDGNGLQLFQSRRPAGDRFFWICVSCRKMHGARMESRESAARRNGPDTVIVAQEGRQFEFFQVMLQQEHGGIFAHATPPTKSMYDARFGAATRTCRKRG